MFDGNTIYLHNYSRPLAQRTRKSTGPYMHTVGPVSRTQSNGRGFYMDSANRMADYGSFMSLRVEDANKHLSGRLAHIDGYFVDNYCGDTLQPIILRLPHSRGFLAGWTMGAGMISTLDASTIWDDVEDAAREAHRMAERDAEAEREYREE